MSDTEHQDLATCPHCGHVDRDSWELISESDETECDSCGEPYRYTRHTSVTYTTTKLDDQPAPDKLYWHCRKCGAHDEVEPTGGGPEEQYEHGDSEPCITCSDGVAVVMTTKEAAALEQSIALGGGHAR